MVIELLDFHARWVDEEENRAPLHLIVIEEPEAHLHAQLQQVFIRQVLTLLKEDGDDNSVFASQLIVTTHSPHILYEKGFRPIRYFRRHAGVAEGQTSVVLNLSIFYQSADPKTRGFLERYMKLTHCDLFFADAAILVEGNVERLLIPLMIEKSAPELQKNCLSILEVGGAFAHKFKPLIEFLGLTTLIITDIDSVQAGAKKTTEEDENEGATACKTSEANAVTCNETLIQWLPKMEKIEELIKADDNKKVQEATETSPALIRVAYQTPQTIGWEKETLSLTGRTFEEAFALENLVWCQHADRKHLHLKVVPAKGTPPSLSEIHDKLFKRIKSSGFNKTSFALGLMMEPLTDWKAPKYIEEGLQWLVKKVAPKTKASPPPAANQDKKEAAAA
jgi:predicted ATP-dependent endonuclease of OLD family